MNVGLVKVVVPRPLQGTPKTATIQRSSTGKWDVGFSCERAEPSPLPATGQDVGIEVGLELFAVPTQGEPIENPRFFRRDETALAVDIGKPCPSLIASTPAVGWPSTVIATPRGISCGSLEHCWDWGNNPWLRPRSPRIDPGELSRAWRHARRAGRGRSKRGRC